jgi:hypothetical protein
VSQDKTASVETDGHVLGCCKPPKADMIVVLVWEDGQQIVRRCEMDGIVQTGIRSDAALEAPGRAVDLAQKLHLQPTLTRLNNLCGLLSTGQLRDAEQTNGGDEIHQSLRYADQRADLTNWLEPSPKDRGHARQVDIELHRHLRTEHVPHSPDTCRIALRHQPRER